MTVGQVSEALEHIGDADAKRAAPSGLWMPRTAPRIR